MLKRICTQSTDFTTATTTLFTALRNKGYTRSYLRSVRKEWQNDQIEPWDSPDTDDLDKSIISQILPYSKYAITCARTIRNNFLDVCAETKYSESFRIMPAYRRNKNLTDLLVRSKISNPNLKSRDLKIGISQNRSTREAFRRPYVPLNMKNVIYLITCKKCRKQYVGQTKNSIRTRFHAHVYNVRHN